ncbi:MAG: AsmA family protein, partial [Acetobacteraceae bacterium]|nr:AsmA family protein [Acetobacteraceae bacterium]
MAQRRFRGWLAIPAGIVVVIVLLILFWRWDWFIPLVESRASAALGRPVTIGHMHVALGRETRIVLDDVQIANPPSFPADTRLAKIDHLAVTADVMAYIHDRALKIPSIDLDRPVVDLATSPSGEDNWKLATGSSGGTSSTSLQIGALNIKDGQVTAKVPRLKADFAMDIATREAEQGQEPQLVVDAKGTYAGQPVTGKFVGGSILSLRDASKPYPIDLRLANGPTHVTLVGTVQDPLAFKGTDVKLDLAGPDMAQLYHLTGIPLPETPPYKITGNLDYSQGKIHFDKFAGTVGHSDLNGSIHVDPGQQRPMVAADLTSRQVDLADLGGFIGSTPGKASEAQTTEQKREHAQAAASPTLLPDQSFNIPKLKAADFQVKYRGQRIEGRSMPLDNLAVNLTITDGNIHLEPIQFGVGQGTIDGNVALDEKDNVLHTRAGVDFHKLDVARMLQSTHMFGGAGTVGGRLELNSTGNSIAKMAANGDGDVKLFMTGGDLSALLVDLAGLDFGSALTSALGLPNRTPVRCMIVDLPLKQGVLDTRTMLLDTEEANITGKGTVNLKTETIDFRIDQEPKHFSIGTLHAPILIRGRLKSPSILPAPGETGARAGIAAALGVLLTPLAALLPTIQLGLGEDNDCGKLIAEAAHSGSNKMSTGQIRSR